MRPFTHPGGFFVITFLFAVFFASLAAGSARADENPAPKNPVKEAINFVSFGLKKPAEAKSDSKEPITLEMDRARVLRLERPADMIIIGNPLIADASVQDRQTLVLTGRSFGVTNLIALDKDGKPILEKSLIVEAHEENFVRIYRRSLRETLTCSPVCENTITVGDQPDGFANIVEQIEKRNNLSVLGAQ